MMKFIATMYFAFLAIGIVAMLPRVAAQVAIQSDAGVTPPVVVPGDFSAQDAGAEGAGAGDTAQAQPDLAPNIEAGVAQVMADRAAQLAAYEDRVTFGLVLVFLMLAVPVLAVLFLVFNGWRTNLMNDAQVKQREIEQQQQAKSPTPDQQRDANQREYGPSLRDTGTTPRLGKRQRRQ